MKSVRLSSLRVGDEFKMFTNSKRVHHYLVKAFGKIYYFDGMQLLHTKEDAHVYPRKLKVIDKTGKPLPGYIQQWKTV